MMRATLLLLVFVSSAYGGTIRHDVADSTYIGLSNQIQFAATGLQNGCSATLIHSEWVLTAAHCVNVANPGSHSFKLPSLSAVSVSEVHVPTGWTGDINDGYDIALLKLSTPILSVTPANIYRGSSELSSEITVVGYGYTGTGQTGSNTNTRNRRAGNNIVDAFATFDGMGGIGVTTNSSQSTSSGLLWDFDSPVGDPEHANTNSMADFVASSADPLALEYSIAPGDSGGGSYIFENSQWYLAGVTSGDVDYFTYPGITGSNRDTYGDLNLVTRVSAYQSFIDNLSSDRRAGTRPLGTHLFQSCDCRHSPSSKEAGSGMTPCCESEFLLIRFEV